jgi:4-amino-4-deoxy-L-arabinose transferase-like glycosyltransferase
VGLAMLTKGPIGLIIPVTAFAVEFAYKRQWKNFFRWQYLIALVVIALILVPMSYGLYEQFDLHPEKKVNDHFGVSGMRFFYWTQSFGRITGENSWDNNPDPFFLYHSFLWSFAPWCVFFIAALFTEIKNKIINFKKPDSSEAITVSGFVLVLFFLSRSHYQLPHYTFAIHPLAAVLTAKYLDERFLSVSKSKLYAAFYYIHIFLITTIFAIVFLIIFYIFPAPAVISAIAILCFAGFLYLIFSKSLQVPKVLVATVLSFTTLVFIFNVHFYPNILSYQTGSYVTKYLNEAAPEGSKLLLYKDYHGFSMQYYCKLPIVEFVDENSLKANMVQGKTYILSDTAYLNEIYKVNPTIPIIERYYGHSPTKLSWNFLNPSTRSLNEQHVVLMKY